MRPELFLAFLWAVAAPVFGDGLPTFEDFRRVDQTRRVLGHLQTAELLAVSQIDGELIMRTVQQNTNDLRVVWGAAELSSAWPQKRALFEAALKTGSDTGPVVVRFACAAARQGEYALALNLSQQARDQDKDNAVPWLIQLWISAARKQPQRLAQVPPLWTTTFRDYSVDASHACIRLLEKAGYSAYSARRLGFRPDSDALQILKDLARPPIEEVTQGLLRDAASYLQHRRPFLLSELVGQSIERTLLTLRADVGPSLEARARIEEIEKRRAELKALLADVERNVVDKATEKQMVQYFDDILALGEEEAMRKLAATVKRSSSSP